MKVAGLSEPQKRGTGTADRLALVLNRHRNKAPNNSRPSRGNQLSRPHLSTREKEILYAVSTGAPHKTIARKLGISIRTVQTHLERVRTKYANVGRSIDWAGHYSNRVDEDELGMEWPFHSLDMTDLDVLRLLSLAGTLPSHALPQILEGRHAASSVERALEGLNERHLVIGGAPEGVYVHKIDQSNIQERFLGDPELQAALDLRIADWLQTQRTEESTWRTSRDVSPQLQEIRHRLRAGDGHRAIQVMMSIAEFLATCDKAYILNGALFLAHKWADTPEARAAYELSSGLVLFHSGRQEEAAAAFRGGLDAAKLAGDDILTARLNIWLDNALRHIGELAADPGPGRPPE